MPPYKVNRILFEKVALHLEVNIEIGQPWE